MRIVFMGTPDFAVPSLQALLDAGHEVCAVYTQPDKPKGRGYVLTPPPVKELALARGIPVLQPATLESLRAFHPDAIVVVAYGKLLPPDVLAVPPLGCVNVHGSLLPKYRGAAPIQWAVLNGDAVSGVTTMYMAEGLDTGDVIFAEETPIGPDETAGELFDRLAGLGGELLVKTVSAIGAGAAPRRPQNHAEATYVGQLDKSLCPIDWSKSPREIIKHVCGLNPWPVATMELAGETLKVFAARYTDTVTDKAPGRVVSAGKDGLEIACGGGKTVLITELQAPGRKRMSAAAYLVGHPVSVE